MNVLFYFDDHRIHQCSAHIFQAIVFLYKNTEIDQFIKRSQSVFKVEPIDGVNISWATTQSYNQK